MPLNLEDVLSDDLSEVINAAVRSREMSRTFRSKVGVAYQMFDGKVIGGFNIETYAHKGYHAEEIGVINALSLGYNGTDFRRLVVVFQDDGHDDVEVFPACPLHCWGTLSEFTHPYLQIIVADTSGKPHYATYFKDMFNLAPPAQMYPSNKIRQIKPKTNVSPKLPLSADLKPFYDSDSYFRELCDTVLKVKVD